MDSNDNLPINLTTDKNIKKLINKFTNPHKKISNKRLQNRELTFIKNLSFVPPRPPRITGKVEKMGNLALKYNLRFIEIDPIVGSLRRFKNFKDFPNNPLETIPIKDIVTCRKITTWLTSKKYFYFEIIYKYRQVYRVRSKYACEKWIESINSSIMFCKFWSKIMQQCNLTLSEYFSKQKDEVLNIDMDELDKSDVTKPDSIAEEAKSEEERTRPNSTKSKNSKGEKKKERRKNPYTQCI